MNHILPISALHCIRQRFPSPIVRGSRLRRCPLPVCKSVIEIIHISPSEQIFRTSKEIFRAVTRCASQLIDYRKKSIIDGMQLRQICTVLIQKPLFQDAGLQRVNCRKSPTSSVRILVFHRCNNMIRSCIICRRNGGCSEQLLAISKSDRKSVV